MVALSELNRLESEATVTIGDSAQSKWVYILPLGVGGDCTLLVILFRK